MHTSLLPIGDQKNDAAANGLLQRPVQTSQLNDAANADKPTLREAFDAFVGETFYAHLIQSMRKTIGKPAYFHGGRGEQVFQGQLDQLLAQRMSESSAEQFSGPMFELFELRRQ